MRTHGCLRIALLGWLTFGILGCPPPAPPSPRVGAHPSEEVARIPVPGGWVAAAGGTLTLVRPLLVNETRIGSYGLGGVHDSVAGAWRWSFDLELRDGVFVDATGTAHEIAALADGAVVPGTDWVRVDAGRLKTRGGLIHAFDGSGHLAAIHWSSDAYPRLRFVRGLVGPWVRTVAIEQCTAVDQCTVLHDLSWDGEGRLASVVDLAGRRAELAWDSAGRLIAARDAGDVENGLPGDRYEWDGNQIIRRTTSDGEEVEFDYFVGRVDSVMSVGPGTPTRTFRYARLGPGEYRTLYEDPTGATTAYHWDDERRLLRLEQVDLGESLRFEWEGLRITRVESPAGPAIAWEWQAGWLVSETEPGGNTRVFAWNPDGVNRLQPTSGSPTAIADDLGTIVTVSYDGAGRPVAIADGVGDVRTLTWDGVELASLAAPAGAVQFFEGYGEQGLPTMIRVGEEIVDEPVYDLVGNRLRGVDLADPLATSTAGVARRTFDADRRVATLVTVEEDPANAAASEVTTRIHRRADGRPLWIERPYGGDTVHVYDAFGRRVERRERVDGVWHATTFGHDAAGRPTFAARPNGMRLEWAYDPSGRVLTSTALRDGLVESVLTSTWESGRLSATHDSVTGEDEVFHYDAAGRVERVVHGDGEATELAYDLRSRVIDAILRLPNGSVLQALGFDYDGNDRETSVRDGGVAGSELLGRVHTAGRLVEARYGNGLTRHYEYSEGGRWAASTTEAADGSFVADFSMSVAASDGLLLLGMTFRTADPLGWVTDPPEGSAPGEVQTTEAYWLDAGFDPNLEDHHGMRLRFSDSEGTTDLGGTMYDGLGNRLSVREALTGPAVTRRDFIYNDEHNRLLEIHEVVYEDGAWVSVPYRTYTYDEAGFVSSIDGVPITWNARGRIESVGLSAEFVWDAAGRPVSRTVLGEETVYWFGGRLEASPGELPTHLDLGEVRLDLENGDHRYRHVGPRGNVQFVTDTHGDVVTHHRYAAYRRIDSFGPETDDRGFAGGTHAAGFVVLGARVLDPEAGRFLSPDPIETVLDAYAYTWGNPIQLWDPSGMQGQAIPPGPPVSATVFSILGHLSTSLGVALTLTGTPFGLGFGVTLTLLGGVFRSVATAIRDDAARGGENTGGGSVGIEALPAVPPVPAAGLETTRYCVDGHCFTKPNPPSTPGGPGGGGGGGGGGLDFGTPGCGGSVGICGLGPELVLVLPWLIRLRRRAAI